MNQLTNLTLLRKKYSELLKIFFYEVQKGTPLHELSQLKDQIELTRLEIERLKRELNINSDDKEMTSEET